MITRDEIRELANFHSPETCALTFYYQPATPQDLSYRGESIMVKNTEAGEVPTGWSADGMSVYVYKFGEVPANVFQLDIGTGQRKPWKQLVPGDSAGIDTIRGLVFSANGNAYVYGYIRTLSDLYLVDGVK